MQTLVPVEYAVLAQIFVFLCGTCGLQRKLQDRQRDGRAEGRIDGRIDKYM